MSNEKSTTRVKKNAQGYGYCYVNLAQIHEYLESNNISYYQTIERIDNDDYIVTVPIIDGKPQEPRRGVKVVDAVLSGIKNPAQESGSAITYARRYSLLMAFGLATEDNDAENFAKTDTAKKADNTQSNKADSNKKDDKDMPDYKERLKDVFAELKRTGYTESHIKKHYKISHIKFMSNLQRDDFLAKIKNVPDKDANQEKIEGSSDEFMDASGADEIPFEDSVQFTEADETELLDLFK